MGKSGFLNLFARHISWKFHAETSFAVEGDSVSKRVFFQVFFVVDRPFGFNAFILSNEIITGGVSGICALIFFASNEIIPVSVSYFVINVVLLLAALKILGLKFLIKTIFGVFSLSASLSFFEWLLKGQPLLHDQPFMSIILVHSFAGQVSDLSFRQTVVQEERISWELL